MLEAAERVEAIVEREERLMKKSLEKTNATRIWNKKRLEASKKRLEVSKKRLEAFEAEREAYKKSLEATKAVLEMVEAERESAEAEREMYKKRLEMAKVMVEEAEAEWEEAKAKREKSFEKASVNSVWAAINYMCLDVRVNKHPMENHLKLVRSILAKRADVKDFIIANRLLQEMEEVKEEVEAEAEALEPGQE